MKKQEELICVVVPIYNVEGYLDECIKSIISQTYKNIEIILVNDGSTDKCEEICKKYLIIDKRVQYYKKNNGGLSSARNYGLEKSKADYICFIDSDDTIEPTYIEKLYTFLILNNCDIVMCSYSVVTLELDNKTKETRFPSEARGDRVLDKNQIWHEFYCQRPKRGYNYSLLTVFNKLYKRSLFLQYRFKDVVHEDEFAAHNLFDKCKKIGFIDECLYNYTENRKGSIMDIAYNKDLDSHCLNCYKFSLERMNLFIANRYNREIIHNAALCWRGYYNSLSFLQKIKYVFPFNIKVISLFLKKAITFKEAASFSIKSLNKRKL